jgi:hypothetical protein
MWFELAYVYVKFLEKCVVYPMIFLAALSTDLDAFKSMPPFWGALVMTVVALKCFRASYSDCSKQYLILLTTVLLFRFDPATRKVNGVAANNSAASVGDADSDPFIVHYFVVSILFHKVYEFYLKVRKMFYFLKLFFMTFLAGFW